MNSLIAAKLNVLETAIVRIEEWTHVLFVVVKGLGARFVSKKVVEVKKMTSADCMTKQYSASEIIVTHYNTGAWAILDTASGQVTSEYHPSAPQVTPEHKAYALSQATFKKSCIPSPVKRPVAPSKQSHRRTCLNCDASGILTNGLCTGCYGEF